MPNQTAERGPQLPAVVAEALSRPIVADNEEEREQQLARVIERVAIIGDLALMAPTDRVLYYAYLCRSLGLNPLTRPFEFISLNGKLTLYPRRDTTDQLRVKRGVTIDKVERQHDTDNDLAIITAWGHTPDGRQDQAQGIVFIGGLRAEALANAWMKAETKAKRRLTLSLVGLGMLDETEVSDTPTAVRVEVDPDDGTIKRVAAPADGATRTEQVSSMIGDEVGATADDAPLQGDELERWLRGTHAAMTTRTEDDPHEQLRGVAAATVELGDRSLNDLTRTEWRRLANEIASLPVIEQPGQDPDGAPSGGHPAPADEPATSVAGDGEVADARAAASSTATPAPESRSSDPATAQADEADPPGTQPAPSTEQPEQEQGRSIPAPVVGAPAPVSPLAALRSEPSADTLLAFALDVLGILPEEGADPVTLGTFTAAEWSQVISEAVDTEDEWTDLYKRLPAVAKAQLRARKQHPAGRAEAKTMPAHPTAEQLKTALGEGEG